MMILGLVAVVVLVVMGVKHQRVVKNLDIQSVLMYLIACVIALPWLFYMWIFLVIVFWGV